MNVYEVVSELDIDGDIREEHRFVLADDISDVWKEFCEWEEEIIMMRKIVPISRNLINKKEEG